MRVHEVAILGAGIGAKHMDGLLANRDRFHVATVCDLDAERAGELATRGENCAAVTDLDAVLADPALDLVAICLPPRLHTPIAIRALEAGKHVVCEKPFALSLRDADRMIAVANAAERTLTPVFQYRYGLGFRQLLHLINVGLAGDPLVATLETHWNRGEDYYAIPWRGTWAGEGGGCILTHAIHVHDMLTCAFGPIASVSADLATRVNPIEVDDCAALSLRHASGALATSSVTLGAAEETSRLKFCFANVTAESGLEVYHPAEAPWTFTARIPARQADIDAALAMVAPEKESFAGFYADLGREFAGEAARGVSTKDGRQSIELVTALYRAAKMAQSVAMPLDASADGYDGWAPED